MGQFKRVRKKSLTGTLQKRVNNVLTGKYKEAFFVCVFFVCECGLNETLSSNLVFYTQ